MPTSYASNVSGKDKLFFIKLLLRWYGSVYQAVYVELIIFLLCYVIVALIFNLALNETQQFHYRHFMNVSYLHLSLRKLQIVRAESLKFLLWQDS